MKTTWNLDPIYKGFNDPSFTADWSSLPVKIKEMDAFAKENFSSNDNAAEKTEAFVALTLELEKLYRIGSFINLTLSTDTTNAEANKYADRFYATLAELSGAMTIFKAYLGKHPNLKDIIASKPLLAEHSFYLTELAKESHHMASEAEESLLATLRTTGSDAWSTLFEMLTSTLMVNIDLEGQPKEITLSDTRNLAYSKDAIVRKTAYEAELAAYPKIEISMASAINAIKGEAITVAKLRHYDSVLDMTLAASRMDKETLDAMWGAIKDSLPAFRKYLRRKGEMLGHTNGLPFYDMFAPVGDADLHMTYEEATKMVIENFTVFNPKMGEFAQHAIEKQWIDVYPRKGKRGGAFCHTIGSIKESRILHNFSDSLDGTTTLAHELGHAYHSACLREETSLNSDYSMPIAETASTFCETLVLQAALKSAPSDKVLSILETSLVGTTQVLVDIYSRYLFETAVIEARANGPLSVEEINNLMLNAQREAYGDGLDSTLLHPSMWICKPHYYSADLNFYNFPYAYGQLFALGLYAKYLKEGESFLPKYDALFAATGKNNLRDVALLADIDVRDRAFWQSSLDIAIADVERFMELSK